MDTTQQETALQTLENKARGILKAALQELLDAYGDALGRKPSYEEVRRLADEQFLALRETPDPGGPGGDTAEGGALEDGRAFFRHIRSIEEARRMAADIVEHAKPYRIPSCEMTVHRDEGTVSLYEEQVLSDGTKVLGRLYTFETHEEAIDSVSRILWEFAREWNEGGMLILLRNPKEMGTGDLRPTLSPNPA